MIFIRFYIPLFVFLFISIHSFGTADKLRCMWRSDPSTTMVVGWDQVSGNSPVLYYDEIDWGNDISAYAYSRRADRTISAKKMNNHFVRLSGLRPNTVYYFLIVDSEGYSKRYSFKTVSNDPNERLSIVAGGDSRNYREARRNANKLVGKLMPDCVMFGGDMTGGDTGKEWIDWFNDWQHTIRNGRIIPVIAARGNHEYSNETIYNLFDTPSEKNYYGLTLGGDLLRIYTLNSMIASGGDQKAWLRNDLESNQHLKWRFAQYHFAIRPHTKRKSERNNQLNNWAKLFYSHKVKLVMESDAHVVKVTYPIRPSRESGSDEGFIRDDVNGTIYIGEGCWGAPLRRNNDDKSWTKSSGSFNQFKWIFVDQYQIDIRTVRTDNADLVGEVQEYDRFSAPDRLDIWNLTNGGVTTIVNKEVKFVSAKPTPTIRTVIGEMKVADTRVNYANGRKVISWRTINEPMEEISFEVQRSTNGTQYQTFALVSNRGIQTRSSENLYEIEAGGEGKWSNFEQVSYRIKQKRSSGEVVYYNVKKINVEKKGVGAVKVLSPDSKTGLLKIKYNLNDSGDVDIRLVDNDENEINQSVYKNQRSGNYLKSIDMSDVPLGVYMLIIKKDESVIDRYRIEKKV